jgi:murein DD-endopeptidase MepM/ murein hydrolase activator NlpD
MNLKWKKKKLTIMIIPEADQSVVRFRIPNIYAYAAICLVSVLFLASVAIYFLHAKTLSATGSLKNELQGANQQLQATTAEKNQAIEQLQNEVIQLSQQTQQMKIKVDEMKKLENDLKVIAQIDTSSDDEKAIAAASSDSTAAFSHGVGGSLIDVTQEDILALSGETKSTLSSLDEQMDTLRTSFAESKQKVQEKQHLLRITPTIWPTNSKTVTSGFGYRKDPFTSQPSFHSGLDIGAQENSPVYSAADGKVVSTGSDSSHGNNIVIEHSKGLRTWYMHLNKILVNQGDNVQKGQTIGLVGSTGRSTGAHLHYEVIKNGVSVDPRPYVQTTRKDEP